ncbi:MAG: DUF3086 domain-containing protein [Cyanobacteria bacterium P01_H01_bin.121]
MSGSSKEAAAALPEETATAEVSDAPTEPEVVTTEASLPESSESDAALEAAGAETSGTSNGEVLNDIAPVGDTPEEREAQLLQRIAALEQREAQLQAQIETIQVQIGELIQDGLQEFRDRKQSLKTAIEKLERRRERIEAEMQKTFAGASQELAIRVQSFKDYLVGSLQDLASTAEQLDLPKATEPAVAAVAAVAPTESSQNQSQGNRPPQFAEQNFQDQTRQIQRLLDRYQKAPDYYGPPWQLRRTFEPVHAERVADWFFQQGGRGAIRSMMSRTQNVLIASAAISILNEFYGERLCALVLANTPERLGEWRRSLQDCLGISRADFGPNQGVMLFEAPEPLAQRADRLIRDGDVPLVLIDETEAVIDLGLLQFPLWLAFATDPRQMSDEYF